MGKGTPNHRASTSSTLVARTSRASTQDVVAGAWISMSSSSVTAASTNRLDEKHSNDAVPMNDVFNEG